MLPYQISHGLVISSKMKAEYRVQRVVNSMFYIPQTVS